MTKVGYKKWLAYNSAFKNFNKILFMKYNYHLPFHRFCPQYLLDANQIPVREVSDDDIKLTVVRVLLSACHSPYNNLKSNQR